MRNDDPPVFHPTSFADVQRFADIFRSGYAVDVSLDGLSTELTRRVIDFVSGMIYLDGGKITKAAEKRVRLEPRRQHPPGGWGAGDREPRKPARRTGAGCVVAVVEGDR